ncbi:hypothetical protein FHR91_002759 [Erythrobacter lutimaris]|nr:hypothetical protein [Alteriqipengyuania lutimaris]
MSYKVSMTSRVGGVIGVVGLVFVFLIALALAATLIFGP